MQPNPKYRLLLGIACGYSILLFFVANYLPVITNGLAAMLTWVVYAKIVRGVVVFMAALITFVFYISWRSIPRRRLFVKQLLLFAFLSWRLLGQLGDSVNEYIHYPQYATCVLLWHAALKRISGAADSVPVFSTLVRRHSPLAAAIAISLLLGIAEESYQYFAPRRRFDIMDIALNIMGVWLGAILVWILAESDPEN